MKFSLGKLVATPNALAALANANKTPTEYVNRHAIGDWGDLGPADKRTNDNAINARERILSAYILPTGVKIWIITEADRSSTCILLPEDY
jgi:hypothetical protein